MVGELCVPCPAELTAVVNCVKCVSEGMLANRAEVTFQGVRVEVASLSLMTSDSLLSIADCYTDLEEIKQKIQKDRTR